MDSSYIIVTDSASDLSEQQLEHMGVISIPLNTFMKNNPAVSCDLHGADFYNALKAGNVACTSAANLSKFRETFTKILDEGKDILYLAFSSALSCMYATGVLAAKELQEEYPDRRIIVVDTHCASMAEGMLVYLSAEQRERGMSMDENVAYIEEKRLKVAHWVTVDDLLYLKRGGRLSGASALAGTLLGIKPVLYFTYGGKMYVKQKLRGRKNAVLELAKHYGEECSDKEAAAFITQGNDMDAAEMLKEAMIRDYGAKNVVIGELGSVIGAHGGPGTIALFFLAESREP